MIHLGRIVCKYWRQQRISNKEKILNSNIMVTHEIEIKVEVISAVQKKLQRSYLAETRHNLKLFVV